MCKPSRSYMGTARTADAVGVLATVVIGLAVIGIVGPIVLSVGRAVAEVAKLAAIGIGSGAMIAVIIWVTVQILRATAGSRPASRIYLTARQEPARITGKPVSEQNCLTCGDTGRIVRVIGQGDSLRIRACPDCQPAQLTR